MPGPTRQTQTCPTDQIVVGFSGRSGADVDQIVVLCAPLTISGASPTFTLSVGSEAAKSISLKDEIALIDPETNEPIATMRVTEKYSIDKAHECKSVFKTTDTEHPGVKMVMAQGEVNLAGERRQAAELPGAIE